MPSGLTPCEPFEPGIPVPPVAHARFAIGEVVRHRLFDFRGVIFDVDPVFANSEEWYEAIPEEVRPRLFTRFGVGDPRGVGLGLWIVRELAQAHGGDARYEPAHPGARMIVTFPALPAQEKGRTGAATALPPGYSST